MIRVTGQLSCDHFPYPGPPGSRLPELAPRWPWSRPKVDGVRVGGRPEVARSPGPGRARGRKTPSSGPKPAARRRFRQGTNTGAIHFGGGARVARRRDWPRSVLAGAALGRWRQAIRKASPALGPSRFSCGTVPVVPTGVASDAPTRSGASPVPIPSRTLTHLERRTRAPPDSFDWTVRPRARFAERPGARFPTTERARGRPPSRIRTLPPASSGGPPSAHPPPWDDSTEPSCSPRS